MLGSLFGSDAGKATKRAAQQNMGLLNRTRERGMGYLGEGYEEAGSHLGEARDLYQPMAERATRGADLYADALGLGGAEGNARATGAFQAGPGYQFAVDQAMQGAARAGSAAGRLDSGNTRIALQDRAHGLANQEYGDWLGRLSGYNNAELAAIQGQSGVLGNLANLGYGYGTDRAGLESQINAGLMSANNQYAHGAEQQAASQGNLLGNAMGLGGKLLGGALGFF